VARLVTAFLVSFFRALRRYRVHPRVWKRNSTTFSAGQLSWAESDAPIFGTKFSKAVEQTRDLKISDVINALDQDLGPHFLPGPGRRLRSACLRRLRQWPVGSQN